MSLPVELRQLLPLAAIATISFLAGCPSPRPKPTMGAMQASAASSMEEPAAPSQTASPVASLSSVGPRVPIEPPAPSVMSYLVWGPPQADGSIESTTTYWVAAEGSGPRIVGRTPGVVVFDGNDAWRWSTKEWRPRTVCDEKTSSTLAHESVFIGALVRKVGTNQQVDIVKGSNDPLECMSILDSRVSLIGSVGSLLFIDAYYHEYGGGAHGINQPTFIVFDLSSLATWEGWATEATVTDEAQRALRESVGENPRGRLSDGGYPYVNIVPSMLKPAWDPRGALRLTMCYQVADTNVPDLWPSLSHGPVQLGDCPGATIPARLSRHAQAPDTVVQFARRVNAAIGGWSALPAGVQAPAALIAQFTGT